MNEGSKSYLGTVDNILKAAILYDILAIQAKGLKAKTNFNFNKRELYSFLQIPSLVKMKKNLMAQKKLKVDWTFEHIHFFSNSIIQ